jgi:cold shock CspA family protein
LLLALRNNGSVNQGGGSERQGRVTFFNTSKGFGFIKDCSKMERVFLFIVMGSHVPLKKMTLVSSFETERGFKGLNAIKVKVVK